MRGRMKQHTKDWLRARIAELESDRSADLGVFKLCEISGGIGLLIGWLAGRFL